ncbi:28612_t:CDS:2 [Dentiscutata erythropus]|uniref:28612_t:CDS:1 n=1 Tax=Dentiscutata erythropus TaxID=1348616 RepID=A0A9N9CW74_9GLOM|nr:28612_t:CDS:2 [Dentiscutata erythropus]
MPFLDIVFEKNVYDSEEINNKDENQGNNKTNKPNQTNSYQLPCLNTLSANLSTLQSHPNNNFQRVTSEQQLPYSLAQCFKQRTEIHTLFSNSISIVESNSISWQNQSLIRKSEVVAVLI